MQLHSGPRVAAEEEAGRATAPRRWSRVRPDRTLTFPEEILQEILARLPPDCVLRCRAVCRAWRRLATDPAFLLDHHRRQPELPLISSYSKNLNPIIRTLRRRDATIRAVFRFPELVRSGFTVRASCDGLLVVGNSICNPATRQCAPLSPNLKLCVDHLLGLFRHQPSGEYRVLYWRYPNNVTAMDCLIEYRVLTVGADDARVVDCSVTQVETEVISRGGPKIYGAAALLNGNLHLHWRKSLGVRYHKILVFDTVAETFRHMIPPAVNPRHVMHLLDMGGTLAASTSKDGMTGMSIFMLQDCKHDIWVFQYRINLPVMDIRRFQEHGIGGQRWCLRRETCLSAVLATCCFLIKWAIYQQTPYLTMICRWFFLIGSKRVLFSIHFSKT